jgi:hypothetical protein
MTRVIGQRARSQTILVHFLLIATMVQGITPDQHNLASPRLLHVLFLSQDLSNSPVDEQDSPDEEALSTEPDNGLVSRLPEWCIEDPEGLIVQGIGFDLLRFRCPPGNLLNPARLSILLCRLTC